MINIAKSTKSSLSIISLMVYEAPILTIKVKYSHAANLFCFFTYTNYVVTEMFQKLKNPATTILLIENLQSLVSVAVRYLIK